MHLIDDLVLCLKTQVVESLPGQGVFFHPINMTLDGFCDHTAMVAVQ
jgi:hypothetical protein